MVTFLAIIVYFNSRICFCNSSNSIGIFNLTNFFFKMLAAPADYLDKWLKAEKEGVQHATQAVIYLVALPTVFGFQVLLSLNAFSFFFQWFFLQIQAYILTLGGTKWQPFITEAKF